MAVAIRVPDLGTTVDEIKLVSWLVEEGETVRRGQPIAEIETDKAVSELECVAEGVLLKHVAQPDQVVETGAVLAYVGRAGEAVPDEPRPEPASTEPSGAGSVRGQAASPRARVSPVVRNLAKKLGVDLESVRGSGQGGTITREDVVRASQAPTPASDAEALPRAQAAVARAVSTSNREIPHLHITAELDMTRARRVRAESETQGTKVSYDALLVEAMARAIEAVPLVAARLVDGRIVRPEGVHIAVAVGSDNDLLLPVIRDVDRKDLVTLHGTIADLAARCRAGTLKPEEMTGACMTLSNLGMYPIESFDAIIFPEHSSILAVGSVRERPVVVDGKVVVRPTAMATLAVDHRLINGRTAAAFLTKVKQVVETGADEL